MIRRVRQKRVLPGFGLTLGYALVYLSLIVLLPLACLLLKSTSMTWDRFWSTVTDPRVVASYKLSFGASLAAAVINTMFGLLVTWALVRYRFPGRKLIDAWVDLPFALPTAVAGIALTSIYAGNGWIGQYFEAWGVKAAFAPLGVDVALTFIGLPFVVRTVQPILEDLDPEIEQAAASLGAARWQTVRRVILPELWPALLTGFALAFARALGEYGSVVFISGNLPMRTEITPLLIIVKLEQYPLAIAELSRAIRLDPDYALPYYHLGGAYRRSAQFSEAADILKNGRVVADNSKDAAMVGLIEAALEKSSRRDATR